VHRCLPGLVERILLMFPRGHRPSREIDLLTSCPLASLYRATGKHTFLLREALVPYPVSTDSPTWKQLATGDTSVPEFPLRLLRKRLKGHLSRHSYPRKHTLRHPVLPFSIPRRNTLYIRPGSLGAYREAHLEVHRPAMQCIRGSAIPC